MGLIFQFEDGQTPLDEDEKEGLLIGSITTRDELNEWEQSNIEEAMLWIARRRRKFSAEEVLSEAFIRTLHRRMYGNVWKWAGEFRKTGKNIGVLPFEIPLQLRQLIDDCKTWIEHKVYDEDEIATRFKHRIVQVHCFANGNGRHSRLIADVIVSQLFAGDVFSWGAVSFDSATARLRYLQALREADNGNYTALLKFVRQ